MLKTIQEVRRLEEALVAVRTHRKYLEDRAFGEKVEREVDRLIGSRKLYTLKNLSTDVRREMGL